MVEKVQKINFWCILIPLLGSLTLLMGYKIQLWCDFSSVDFIYLIQFFSRIVWIDKLHNLMKGFDKCCHRNMKNTFFQLSWQRLLRGKMLHQKHESHRHMLPLKKIELIGYVAGKIKCRNLKNVHFEKNPIKIVDQQGCLSPFWKLEL